MDIGPRKNFSNNSGIVESNGSMYSEIVGAIHNQNQAEATAYYDSEVRESVRIGVPENWSKFSFIRSAMKTTYLCQRSMTIEAVDDCMQFIKRLHGRVSTPAGAVGANSCVANSVICGSNCSLFGLSYREIVHDLPESTNVSENLRYFWPGGLNELERTTPVLHLIHCNAVAPAPIMEYLPADATGVKTVIEMGCYNDATNWIAYILNGSGHNLAENTNVDKVVVHTPLTMQYWLTRFLLLIKLRNFDILSLEIKAFDQLNTIDMSFQTNAEYVETPQNRSIVCFCFRLIIAQAPLYYENPETAPNRLLALFAHCRAIQNYFRDRKPEWADFWHKRQIRVGYCIVSYAVFRRNHQLIDQVCSGLIADCPTHDEAERAKQFAMWAYLRGRLVSSFTNWDFLAPYFTC